MFYLINKYPLTDQAPLNTGIAGDSSATTQSPQQYHVAIIGGGLAGLTLAIQLSRLGYQVILFEKEQYPFHKVCGEYISYESWDFLQNMGLDLSKMGVSHIKRLLVSAPNGKTLEHILPLGGFGVSRYSLDHALARIALSSGVRIEENTKVNDIVYDELGFTISTSKGAYRSLMTCGSFGKRSNIDIRWKRKFAMNDKSKLNNFVAVKYHVKTSFPRDTIALHNFQNGYCGISKIEDDRYCLCYLTTAENLQRCHGSIAGMEEAILMQNPHLKQIFGEAEKLFEAPLAISQISFDKKNQVDRHVLMTGDAAGMITPLCGNGMSMAMHGSKIAATQIARFLQDEITRQEMEQNYTREWNTLFASRLRMGRAIQRFFGRTWLTNSFVSFARSSPKFVNYLVKRTHGVPF